MRFYREFRRNREKRKNRINRKNRGKVASDEQSPEEREAGGLVDAPSQSRLGWFEPPLPSGRGSDANHRSLTLPARTGRSLAVAARMGGSD